MNMKIYALALVGGLLFLWVKKADDTRVNQLEVELKKIKNETTQSIKQLEQSTPSRLLLDLTSKDLRVIESSHGKITISVVSVVPYLDGLKIVLSIGNMTSARFQGVEMDFAWGLDINKLLREDVDKEVDSDEYNEKARNFLEMLKKKKKISSSVDILPASFTKIELVINPADPESSNYFELSNMIFHTPSLR